ncbi:MAG: hypothetical protein D3923_13890 [Candidatus Electrothrix sp. AR3]|nr:hypothetical protein [Candidatus Electrothrix sp. AR3]
MEDELKRVFGPQTEVELIPGSGGVYTVCADGRQVFSKTEISRFPRDGEIVALLKKTG